MTDAIRTYLKGLQHEVDRLMIVHRNLSPKYGEIAVGGAHMDSFFEAEAYAELIRELYRGKSIPNATTAAKTHASVCITKWNQSRKDYQVHRYVKSFDTRLDHIERTLLNL